MATRMTENGGGPRVAVQRDRLADREDASLAVDFASGTPCEQTREERVWCTASSSLGVSALLLVSEPTLPGKRSPLRAPSNQAACLAVLCPRRSSSLLITCSCCSAWTANFRCVMLHRCGLGHTAGMYDRAGPRTRENARYMCRLASSRVGSPSTTTRRPLKPGACGRCPLRRRSYRQTAPGPAL